MENAHHVVIVGGGFGGLYAAQSLKNGPFQVTLIDRRNFHLFQPLLYQVATGWLSPANIASTLRSVLRHQKNARVLLAEAVDFNIAKREVILDEGTVAYDTLVVAAGSGYHYFGNEHWRQLAPGLKTIEDATDMRRRIFSAFEAAERSTDRLRAQSQLTFMIVRWQWGPARVSAVSRCVPWCGAPKHARQRSTGTVGKGTEELGGGVPKNGHYKEEKAKRAGSVPVLRPVRRPAPAITSHEASSAH